MEQNGRFKHALQSWDDLTKSADHDIEKLNNDTSGIRLPKEERVLLDELNKLRAEIEFNYLLARKSIDKQLKLQRYQEEQQQLKQLQQHQQQLQQQQQQLQQSQQSQLQYNNAVPTLRSSIPHTMSSRKPGSKMMKSLRPGGATSYSNSPSTITPTSNSVSNSSNSNLSSQLSQTAANIIWAPSNSLNANNNSNSSLISDINNNNNNSSNEIDEFADFSSTTNIIKKTTSERSKAALKASAAVKYPARPEVQSQQAQQQSTRQYRSNRSRSPQIETTSPNPPLSLSDNNSIVSPIRKSTDNTNSNNSKYNPISNDLDENGLNDKQKVAENDENLDGTKEEDEDSKILKKIKGVDLKFAKNILVESSRDQDKVYWSDIAGLEQAKETLMETVVYPFLRPDLFRGLREPVSGMLLFGPPGTGKTMLARAAATESNSTFFSIQSSSLTSKWYGESEKLVRALFQVAKAKAPSIIFVDEIDSLLGKRSGDGDDDTSRRLKNEFLVQWSDLSKAAAGRVDDDEPPARVLVLAATNLPWAIDEAARRRFVRRQYIPLPEPETRMAHFKKLLSHTPNSLDDDEMQKLVDLTEGYSGSDITSLAKDAAIWPIRELGAKMLNLKEFEIRPISLADFERSMKNIRPSVNKEGLEKFEKWAKEFGSSGA
ncbi:hypothetical protein C6P40_001638 [Pichia californica]|uniref:AAA+ ATPase domain-containing protein n=1 Tax=Pichia californica TaxID=460514 RepID=A0A9P7BIB2_9ASCO|nr:hypothetical protein C6P40_001638 [[Candida] californica]